LASRPDYFAFGKHRSRFNRSFDNRLAETVKVTVFFFQI
jgi:hypothetical protein